MNDIARRGIRITTLHAVALLLGLVGTGLTLLQGRYWLAQMADGRVLILIACVPILAAIAFTLGPHHSALDFSSHRPLASRVVWLNWLAPVLLTALTMTLVAASGHFDHFAGFAMLVAANAGRNLRELFSALWSPR